MKYSTSPFSPLNSARRHLYMAKRLLAHANRSGDRAAQSASMGSLNRARAELIKIARGMRNV